MVVFRLVLDLDGLVPDLLPPTSYRRVQILWRRRVRWVPNLVELHRRRHVEVFRLVLGQILRRRHHLLQLHRRHHVEVFRLVLKRQILRRRHQLLQLNPANLHLRHHLEGFLLVRLVCQILWRRRVRLGRQILWHRHHLR